MRLEYGPRVFGILILIVALASLVACASSKPRRDDHVLVGFRR